MLYLQYIQYKCTICISLLIFCYFYSVTKWCLILCDPVNYSMPGPLSLTINQSPLKFMSIELVMSFNHLILQPSEILQNKQFYNSYECMVQIYSNTMSHGVIFLGSKITADSNYSHEIKRCLPLRRKTMTNLDSILKSRDISLPTKVCLVKAMVFPVVMCRCESWTKKEGWAPKNWCFWTVVLEKTLESPLDHKVKPVHPKGNQSWLFIGGTDAEAEASVLWPPDAKSWLIRKDPDAGKHWRQEEKGMTEDEMVGWHHRLKGREFE